MRMSGDFMTIQVFKPKYRVEECLASIRECLDIGWTGMGFKTLDFEKAWCEYTGLPHAHFLNSATAGLHLAIRILKSRYQWNDDDEVITSPLTFVSANHAILYENLRPVFADVDQYLCLDPLDIESKITERTRCVIFVGLGGNPGQYQRVVEICQQRGIKLILDAAHMAGTRINSCIVGKEADATVFSFQAVKNLPTGDSGMLCMADEEDDKRARRLAWLGISTDTYARAKQGNYKWMYEVNEVGYKYHGNAVMAAIGVVQLRYLDHDNAYRRQIAKWYREHFKAHDKAIEMIPIPENAESATHIFPIMVENRDQLVALLSDKGISVGVHYRDNTEYPMYAHGRGSCPIAAKKSGRLISLPVHMELSKSDVDQIARLVIANV